jgi:ABC-2 type transport system permease protein
MTTAPVRLPSVGVPDHKGRLISLTWTLAVTDWKLRFYGSVLGYLWSLVRPFAFFGVIYFVFTEIADIGASVKNYGLYILFSLVLFGFFSEITGNCLNSLVMRESLLRKMRFPRIVIPLSVATTALLNLGMTLVAVFVFAIASGDYPTWSWLELIPLIALLTLLSLGAGMVLSVLFIRYRDVQPIWEVVTQMLFYASPVLYVATIVPEEYQRPYLANPIASILTQVRHAVVDPSAPDVAAAIGDPMRLLIPLAIIAGVFAVGFLSFKRMAPRIAEEL